MLRRAVSMPCVRRLSTSGGSKKAKKDLNLAPKEYSCNIPPWQPPEPPSERLLAVELPPALIRPPCMPGQTRGEQQTCLVGMDGMYCPPCKLKYKYPPFSENIDFVPGSVQPPCWWKGNPACDLEDVDVAKLASLTKRWGCAYD